MVEVESVRVRSMKVPIGFEVADDMIFVTESGDELVGQRSSLVGCSRKVDCRLQLIIRTQAEERR